MSKRVLGSVPTLLWAILTVSCPQDQFHNSVFRCLLCRQHEGKSDKEKGSHLSQEDFGTRSGEAMSKAAQSPAGRTRSIRLAMFATTVKQTPLASEQQSEGICGSPDPEATSLYKCAHRSRGRVSHSLNTANKPDPSSLRSLLSSLKRKGTLQ